MLWVAFGLPQGLFPLDESAFAVAKLSCGSWDQILELLFCL